MIEIKNINTSGFEAAIRGMRNPYESWDKSDSLPCFDCDCTDCSREYNCHTDSWKNMYFIGKADMELAKKLIKAGSEHRKFLRMIHVQFDIRMPRYFATELDTYKVGTTKNSSSTMHLITKRELTLDDFSTDGSLDIKCLKSVVNLLNFKIRAYKNMSKDEKEQTFRDIKQLLPESFMQWATYDMNYETLLSIYQQRENHRLSEWKDFCDWCLTLPYFSEFIIGTL